MSNTYDTSMYPIGSTNPKVLYNNASNLDDLLLGPLFSYPDRFGVLRQSWAGIEKLVADFLQSMGFEATHLTYVDGTPLTVLRPTQLIDRAGSVYKIKTPATFPFTLTGNFATDAPNMVDVSDAALRGALAATGGSAMIGTPRGTVESDILALKSADTTLQTNIDNAVKKILPTNQAQPLASRSSNVLNQGQGVVILGDSISAGAYQGNAYTDGPPYLLAKSVNAQFGSRNLGVFPMDALYNPVPQYQCDQIHEVTWSAGWGATIGGGAAGIYNWPVGNVGNAAGDAVNGKTVSSSNFGTYFEIVVPSINKFITIYYVGIVGGGKFDVSLNGAVVSELNTAVSTVKTYNLKYNLIGADNGQGFMTIRFTKKDALPTEIQPIVGYAKTSGDLNAHFGSMNVCNFSVSGRQLATLTENSIIQATNCAAIVVALSFNDSQAETDDTYYGLYLQRVNWIIQYANVFKCLVVVADFCWYSSPTSRRRTQLRRIAEATGGTYIGFPDKFYPDGTLVPDTSPSATALVDPMRLWADNAHPNPQGHAALIFPQIARALGLNITSKQAALLADLPYPLRLSGTNQNKVGDLSTISRTPNGYQVSLGITGPAGANLPAGSPLGATVPTKFAPAGLMVRAGSSVMSTTTAGAVNNVATVTTAGAINLVIVNASVVEGTMNIAVNASL
ncbi:hypothetical protein [Pseudomonas tolaasii]